MVEDQNANGQNQPVQVSPEWERVRMLRQATELAEKLNPDNPSIWEEQARKIAEMGNQGVANLYSQLQSTQGTQGTQQKRFNPPSQGIIVNQGTGGKTKDDIVNLVKTIRGTKTRGPSKNQYGLAGLLRLRAAMLVASEGKEWR